MFLVISSAHHMLHFPTVGSKVYWRLLVKWPSWFQIPIFSSSYIQFTDDRLSFTTPFVSQSKLPLSVISDKIMIMSNWGWVTFMWSVVVVSPHVGSGWYKKTSGNTRQWLQCFWVSPFALTDLPVAFWTHAP